jgi:hypothetical protein
MEASHVPHVPHAGRMVVIPLLAALLGAAIATATFALVNIEDEANISLVAPSAEPVASNETGTLRYDGGPQEGAAQRSIPPQAIPSNWATSGPRYDGGPEEGTAQLSIRPQAVPSDAAGTQGPAGNGRLDRGTAFGGSR